MRQNMSEQIIDRNVYEPEYSPFEKKRFWSDSNPEPLTSQAYPLPPGCGPVKLRNLNSSWAKVPPEVQMSPKLFTEKKSSTR